MKEIKSNKFINQIMQEAKYKEIPIVWVKRAWLDQHFGKGHQGIAASTAKADYIPLEELLENIKNSEQQPLLLLLNKIEDPHNLGAILRSAEATGVQGVIIPKRHSVGLTSTVAKASAGALAYVPIVRVTNLAQTIDKLKEDGYWIIGAEEDGETNYNQIDYNIPLVLAMGSEHSGLGKLLRSKCDIMAHIQMVGQISSLNVSVATAVILFAILNNRQTK